MTASLIALAVLAPAMLALTVIGWASTRSRRWQERELMKLAQRRNLAVPDHLEEELLRHIVRRRRAWMLGFGSAYLLVYVPASLLVPAGGSTLAPLMLVLAFAIGVTVTTVVTLIDRRRAVFGSSQVGRLDGPTVDDLLPPAAIRVMTVAALVAVGASALVALLPRPRDDAAADLWVPLALTLAAVSVVTLMLWHVAARRIAASRPISGDETTLAWSDALRAESVSILLLLPAVSALYCLLVAIPNLVRVIAPDQFEAFDVGILVALAVSLSVIIGVMVQTTSGPGALHYQRRLWPELAAATAMRASPDPEERRA